MLYFKALARQFLLISCLILNIAYVQAQSQSETDAALGTLKSMKPEQVEMMLKMAMNTLPPNKRSDLEDALKLMKATRPETQAIEWKHKSIIFVPIAHASTPEFYNGVKSVVSNYKAKGYTVFYEQITRAAKKEETAGKPDTLALKLRKLVGLEPTRQTYAILKNFFPGIVAQPEYKDLGVTASDLNADISLEQLVGKYEDLYGPVALNNCDFETKTGVLGYNCGALGNDIEPVILDYRNENVARLVKSAVTDKILVVYGAKHIPGIIKLLSED